MRLIDLSQPLYHDAPNCPAHPAVVIRTEGHVPDANGISWQMEFLEFASHTGSHVDVPLHRLPNSNSLDETPLEAFTGPAILADLRGLSAGAAIGPELLEATAGEDVSGKILLLATGWSERKAKTDEWLYHSPFLSPEGARWLVENGIRGVGIDHYSVGGSADDVNPLTHEILLSAGIWVVEELQFPAEVFDLSWPQQFMALPINLRGASGAPCRPVLVLSE
jgi:kynurenine formamidase